MFAGNQNVYHRTVLEWVHLSSVIIHSPASWFPTHCTSSPKFQQLTLVTSLIFDSSTCLDFDSIHCTATPEAHNSTSIEPKHVASTYWVFCLAILVGFVVRLRIQPQRERREVGPARHVRGNWSNTMCILAFLHRTFPQPIGDVFRNPPVQRSGSTGDEVIWKAGNNLD